MYQSLAKRYAEAIIGFHVFTGSAQTGKFSGKSKKDCIKVFLDCTPDELDPFSLLRCDKSGPSGIINRRLQQFL